MSTAFVESPLKTGSEEDYSPAELTSALYVQLRRIANRYLGSERRDHTLQPTALVHEAWLKMSSAEERTFSGEAHFLAVASRVMRQVLVDYARSRSTRKRFGGLIRESFGATVMEARVDGGPELVEVLLLDDALAALAAEHELSAKLVEMRYFGGMTAEESAEALRLSVHVVRHHLRFAQAWLRRRLHSQAQDSDLRYAQ